MSTPTYIVPLAVVPKFWELVQIDMATKSRNMPDLSLRELVRKEGGTYALREVQGKRTAEPVVEFKDEQAAVVFKLKHSA